MPKVNLERLAREQEFVPDQECMDHGRYVACSGCGKRFCMKCEAASAPLTSQVRRVEGARCLPCAQADEYAAVYWDTVRKDDEEEMMDAAGWDAE